MIEGQEVMEKTNLPTFCWRSTNKGSFSTDMYGCIFHSFSVWYNFCNAFSSETACGPPMVHERQFEKHWRKQRTVITEKGFGTVPHFRNGQKLTAKLFVIAY